MAAALTIGGDMVATATLAAIAATTVYARQVLMPAINRATDAGNTSRFRALHGTSVAITLVHIVCAGWILVRLAT
jgi:hypothetical protein